MALLSWRQCRHLLIGLLMSTWVPPDSISAPVSEAQLRAALVYNFASFTVWPDPDRAGAPLVIGVLGNDAVATALQAIQRLGNGREIDVRVLTEGDGLERCHVLYVSAIPARAVAATLARVMNMPVLTVGEQERFTQMGGLIRVYFEGSRLRFEVDAAHAASVQLKISSRVLDLARHVREPDAPNP